MSQSWTADLYTAATVADTTLSDMELMFATLKSSFSGTSAPGSVVAGQVWYDTAKTLLKYQNNASSAWRGILAGSGNRRFWLWNNDAEEGWAIDATVTDNVLAIKGGSNAYNVSGGLYNRGSWSISGVTTGGTAISIAQMPAHAHPGEVFRTEVGGIEFGSTGGNMGNAGVPSQGSNATHNHGVSSDAGWRPSAAVGTLQYLDI